MSGSFGLHSTQPRSFPHNLPLALVFLLTTAEEPLRSWAKVGESGDQ